MYRFLNPLDFVAFKMGRRSGLDRTVRAEKIRTLIPDNFLKICEIGGICGLKFSEFRFQWLEGGTFGEQRGKTANWTRPKGLR